MLSRSVLYNDCLEQYGPWYNTNMQPSFLNTPLNFSTFNFNTQIHFQFLNVSIDQKTQPSICFKTQGQVFQTLNQAFQTLSQAFQTLDGAFEALRETEKFG